MPGPLWLPSETQNLLKALYRRRQAFLSKSPGLWNEVAEKVGATRSPEACRKRTQYLIRHASVSTFLDRLRLDRHAFPESQANELIQAIVNETAMKRLKDVPWSMVEDMVLVDLINQDLNWEEVARRLSAKTSCFRNSVQCRQRYALLMEKKNKTHPTCQKCRRWTTDELKQLCIAARQDFLANNIEKSDLEMKALNSTHWLRKSPVPTRTIGECRQKWMRLPVAARMRLLQEDSDPAEIDFNQLTGRNHFSELDDRRLLVSVEKLSKANKWPTENHINWLVVAATYFPDVDIRYLQYRWRKMKD